MKQDFPTTTQSDDAMKALDHLLCKALEIRQRYHGMLFTQTKIADAQFTRSLSDRKLALLRQVWINDTDAYMRGAQCETDRPACEQSIPAFKEFHVELFFDDMSTAEIVFMKLVAHPFIDDANRIQILLEALSSLPLLSPAFHGCDPKTTRTDWSSWLWSHVSLGLVYESQTLRD